MWKTFRNPDGAMAPNGALRRRVGYPSVRIIVAALLALASSAPACGPFFPNNLLSTPSESVAWAPVADFSLELDRIAPRGSGEFRAVNSLERIRQDLTVREPNPAVQSTRVDVAELIAALTDAKVPPSQLDAIVQQYRAFRAAIEDFTLKMEAWRERTSEGDAKPLLRDITIPTGLPDEFAAYAHGLLAYRQDQVELAHQTLQALLDRPAVQRPRRTVWAAFLLGKTLAAQLQPDQAVQWFIKTRALAREGFADPLGLAAASFGTQARVELDRGNVTAAIRLYLDQRATGDDTATTSLLLTCSHLGRSSPVATKPAGADAIDRVRLKPLVKDEVASRVVNAFLVARGGRQREFDSQPLASAWLEAVDAEQRANLPNSDRLAWIAYQSGRIENARRWLDHAPTDSPIALWLRAKLMLRDGKLEQGAALLAQAAKMFPMNEEWSAGGGYANSALASGPAMRPRFRVQGELGVYHLSRGDYVHAMDELLGAGWWEDAAYIAERVLSVDELRGYVDQHKPPATAPAMHEQHMTSSLDLSVDDSLVRLRHLLARRLTRRGRSTDARPYFAPAQQQQLDQYVRAIRGGEDEHRSAEERGKMLWEAALLARQHGMELLGTELDPDYANEAGEFQQPAITISRAAGAVGPLHRSEDEAARVRESEVEPPTRFHYRSIAAAHAWKASQLLPDQTDLKAQILCTAGRWLAPHDPEHADRFYQALATQCDQTELGRAAAAAHWFPNPDQKP